MEKEFSCLYQGTRTYLPLRILQEMGRGHCQSCQYNPENNKKCNLYSPVTKFKIVIKPSIESKV